MAPIVWHDFSPMTSKMDWCEPNYAITKYITEFYNTISNIPLLILPTILIVLNRGYSAKVSPLANIIWVFVIIVGLGSTYFHGTLSRMGQLLDEVTISWVVHGALALLFPRFSLPERFKGDRTILRNVLFVLAVIWTVLALIIPAITPVILQFLGVPCVYTHVKVMKNCGCPEVRSLGRKTIFGFVIGTACWLTDQLFCPFWTNIGFPYMHSFFHIFVAYAACIGITCLMYVEALYVVPELSPYISYWPSGVWKAVSLPYIKFDEKIST